MPRTREERKEYREGVALATVGFVISIFDGTALGLGVEVVTKRIDAARKSLVGHHAGIVAVEMADPPVDQLGTVIPLRPREVHAAQDDMPLQAA
jgi:hypothetical protein